MNTRVRLSAVVIAAFAACAVWAPVARSAVTASGSTCTTLAVGSTITLAAPPSTAVGDLLVASIASGDGHSRAPAPSPSTGWTALDSWVPASSSLSAASTWFRIASTSGAATYAFTLHAAVATTGTVIALHDVDPSAPIAGVLPSTNTANGTGASVELPSANAPRSGSLRVSIVQSFAAVSTTYSPGLVAGCDQPYDHVHEASVSSAHEPALVGTTPTRTATLSAGASWHALTFVAQPVAPCSGGSTTLVDPSTISFPAVALDGTDQITTTRATVSVDAESSTGGWALSATSTTFRSDGHALPASATAVVGAVAAPGPGNCAVPGNATMYPVGLPAGTTAPPAVSIYTASHGANAGPVEIDLAFALQIPANAHLGEYSSTWTFTVGATP